MGLDRSGEQFAATIMGLPIITSPRTESQLRSALARLEKAIAGIISSGGGSGLTQTGTAGASTTALQVMYASAANTYSPAQANAVSTSRIAGVALATVGSGDPLTIQTDGIVTGFAGLTFNTLYYLSPSTPGAITSTRPTTVGQVVAPVGLALSSTNLLLKTHPNVLL